MAIGDLLAQITGEPSPSLQNTTCTSKRKADDNLQRPIEKVQRKGSPVVNPPRQISEIRRPPAVDVSKTRTTPAVRNAPTQSTATSASKDVRPTSPPSVAPPKPPKKGSYAEIMARGKAAQASLGQVGKIQHKSIEKLPSKREREEIKAHNAQKSHRRPNPLASNGKARTVGPPPIRDGRNGIRDSTAKVAEASPQKIKKAAIATTGYAGTARPKPGSYKGTSKSSGAASSSRYGHTGNRYQDDKRESSSRPYTYASEEEEEEDGRDYYSDVSSDMEAALYEVDEEEELAAKIARREDAEALAEENRLKREKEEKRRKLTAMAKSRR